METGPVIDGTSETGGTSSECPWVMLDRRVPCRSPQAQMCTATQEGVFLGVDGVTY